MFFENVNLFRTTVLVVVVLSVSTSTIVTGYTLYKGLVVADHHNDTSVVHHHLHDGHEADANSSSHIDPQNVTSKLVTSSSLMVFLPRSKDLNGTTV